jgi:hypothetical protein
MSGTRSEELLRRFVKIGGCEPDSFEEDVGEVGRVGILAGLPSEARGRDRLERNQEFRPLNSRICKKKRKMVEGDKRTLG